MNVCKAPNIYEGGVALGPVEGMDAYAGVGVALGPVLGMDGYGGGRQPSRVGRCGRHNGRYTAGIAFTQAR